MEKGKVRNITSYNGGGTIVDNQGRLMNFNSSGVVTKNKRSLKTGDLVWFERIGTDVSATAINIRSC